MFLPFATSDVFDWNALNQKFKELPPTTAPAGYKCPVCGGPVFPSDNQAGPVADALREKLKTASWARVGLGLPLIPEVDEEGDNNNQSQMNAWDPPEGFNPVNVCQDSSLINGLNFTKFRIESHPHSRLQRQSPKKL